MEQLVEEYLMMRLQFHDKLRRETRMTPELRIEAEQLSNKYIMVREYLEQKYSLEEESEDFFTGWK